MPCLRFSRDWGKLNCRAAATLFFLLCFSASSVRAEGLPVLQPKFLHTKISTLIPGSERTLLCRQTEENGKAVFVGLSPEELTPALRAAADAAAKEGRLNYFRNTDGVVICAILDFDRPIATAAIFSPALLDSLEPVLGPRLLVAAPTSGKVYFFPALAAEVDQLVPFILSEYRMSALPVSEELFEVSRDSIRAIAILDDR